MPVYNSSTLGPLPLSQKGKDLMQNLRVAQQKLVSDAAHYVSSRLNWGEVSRTRGEIVRYIGELEKELDAATTSLAAIRSVDDKRVQNLQQDKLALQKKVEELKEDNGRLHVAAQATAQMSTPLGLLPINSNGMRKLVDEVGRLQEQLEGNTAHFKAPIVLNPGLESYSIGALIGELNKRFHP